MRVKKLLIIALVAFVLTLTGCAKSNSPESLWNRYIDAMNSKDIEKVAEIFYVKNSGGYNLFLQDNTAEEYFADFEKVTTKSFVPDVVNLKYSSAYVTVSVQTSGGSEKKEFYVYFFKDAFEKWNFTTEVSVTAYDEALLGNQPNKNYYNNIILTGDGFDYKYIYGGEAGVKSENDYVKIVYPEFNSNKVVIPSQIDGAPVKTIGDYAFFNFTRILSVTIPRSKLQEIELPNTIETIEQFAFYQTKNLKSLTLPSSLKNVGKYAFASSGIEKLYINVNENSMYGPENIVYLNSRDSMTINGDRTVYMGDNVFYSASGALVDWSTLEPSIATINSLGKLDLKQPGTVTVQATNRANGTLYSTATVTILPLEDKTFTSTSNDPNLVFTLKSDWFVGDIANLTVIQGPVNWSSSDETVATVDSNGRLTAVGTGNVTITATSTSSSNTSTATINVKAVANKSVETIYSYEPIIFTGGRRLYVGDYLQLAAEGYKVGEIVWSSSDSSIFDINIYNGNGVSLARGNALIKATLSDNANIYSSININVAAVEPLITFAENSLDRLYSLKEIHINAINPYSVAFKGKLRLSKNCKIYVPAQNYNTWKTVLSDYSKQIYIIPNS